MRSSSRLSRRSCRRPRVPRRQRREDPDGGWFPLLVGSGVVIADDDVAAWPRVSSPADPSRRAADGRGRTGGARCGRRRVPGTAVYLSRTVGATPPALEANLEHNQVLHETTSCSRCSDADVPRVDPRTRSRSSGSGRHPSGGAAVRVHGRPDVPEALGRMEHGRHQIDPARRRTSSAVRPSPPARCRACIMARASVRAPQPRRGQRRPVLRPAAGPSRSRSAPRSRSDWRRPADRGPGQP